MELEYKLSHKDAAKKASQIMEVLPENPPDTLRVLAHCMASVVVQLEPDPSKNKSLLESWNNLVNAIVSEMHRHFPTTAEH